MCVGTTGKYGARQQLHCLTLTHVFCHRSHTPNPITFLLWDPANSHKICSLPTSLRTIQLPFVWREPWELGSLWWCHRLSSHCWGKLNRLSLLSVSLGDITGCTAVIDRVKLTIHHILTVIWSTAIVDLPLWAFLMWQCLQPTKNTLLAWHSLYRSVLTTGPLVSLC